jgi:hypothetical protein
MPWSIFAILLYASGGISEPVTKDGAPPQPYGTYAEIQGCVASMRASLHGRSILGSRDTAAYIQDQGFLEDLGVTEYDVLVGRCRTRFFHRYNRYYGRQPQ